MPLRRDRPILAPGLACLSIDAGAVLAPRPWEPSPALALNNPCEVRMSGALMTVSHVGALENLRSTPVNAA